LNAFDRSVLPERNLREDLRRLSPKLVTAKCCRALPFDKMDVNYVAMSTFFRVHHSFFKAEDDKLVFATYSGGSFHEFARRGFTAH